MEAAPKLPVTPLDILSPASERTPSYMLKFISSSVLAASCFASVCFGNYALRRPIMSGIQTHIGLTGIGYIVGNWLYNYKQEYSAERDAVMRHYVQLHPEDFPDFESKKYADLFEPWVPIR